MGISVDSPESHRKFIEKHKLLNITLLSDTDKSVIKKYNTKHWLLPVSKRVYIIVDSTGTVIYRKDTGFSLLENQTSALLNVIDKKISIFIPKDSY